MAISRGALFGYSGCAFLFGVALHSLSPYEAMAPEILPWIIGGFLLLSLAPPVYKNKFLFGVIIIFLSFFFGIWRFDLSRSVLPPDLKPFDPSGFAWQRAETYHPQDPRHFISEQRDRISRHISQSLPGDSGALLAGMLYGGRGLSDATKKLFRDAGMLHLIAVSGSNVTILVVIVMRLLLGIGMKRRSAFIGMTSALVAFVIFVGPQASVIRAAIMGWLLEFAPLVGRIPKTSRLLLVSAVVFTLIHPWVLLYDPGFALSFLATVGLLTYGLYLNEILRPVPIPGTLREIFTATTAATVFTLPYSAWAFGQVSLVGVLTNMLAVPLVPWIMGTGVFVLMSPAGSFLHLPAKGFLEIVLLIAEMPEYIPIGVWNNISTGYVFMLGSYVFLYAIWRQLKAKKSNLIERIHKKHYFLS